ncbi:MAG TPA: hypothetical protein VGL23_07875, partial [Chloroflexota bacterium]
MQSAVARPGTGVPPRGQGINGRLAVVLLATIVVVFMAAAVGFAFSQRWRQSERLVAPGLRHPRGIAIVRPDLLAIAEAGPPGRLSWISTSESSRGTVIEGLPSEELGGGPAGPVAVALGADLRLYALTGGCAAPLCAALLWRADAGSLAVVANLRDLAPAGRSDPWGLAIAPDGVLYLTDPGAGAIVRVDPRASPAAAVVLAQPGQPADPRGIARAGDGSLYVALRGAGTVARLAPDGALTPIVAGLERPIGVGVEPDGRLLVLEQGRERAGRLLRVDPARPLDRGVVSADLDRPTALA